MANKIWKSSEFEQADGTSQHRWKACRSWNSSYRWIFYARRVAGFRNSLSSNLMTSSGQWMDSISLTTEEKSVDTMTIIFNNLLFWCALSDPCDWTLYFAIKLNENVFIFLFVVRCRFIEFIQNPTHQISGNLKPCVHSYHCIYSSKFSALFPIDITFLLSLLLMVNRSIRHYVLHHH